MVHVQHAKKTTKVLLVHLATVISLHFSLTKMISQMDNNHNLSDNVNADQVYSKIRKMNLPANHAQQTVVLALDLVTTALVAQTKTKSSKKESVFALH